jgi:deazaflavin-dependent oxidoreductase (nitroreductase family)
MEESDTVVGDCAIETQLASLIEAISQRRSALTERERDIIAIRTTTETRNRALWGRVAASGAATLSESELSWLVAEGLQSEGVTVDGGLSDPWSDADRDLIAVTDRLLANGELDGGLVARLRARGEAQLAEIVTLPGYFKLLGDLAKATDTLVPPAELEWPSLPAEAHVPEPELTGANLARLVAEISDSSRSKEHMRAFNHTLVKVLRSNGGDVLEGEFSGRNYVVLTVTGRKSGKRLELPLRYHDVEGRTYVVASSGGNPNHPQWYLNVLADPKVTVEMRGIPYAAEARPTEGQERDDLFATISGRIDILNDYQARTDGRLIPVVELHLGEVLDPR